MGDAKKSKRRGLPGQTGYTAARPEGDFANAKMSNIECRMSQSRRIAMMI